VAQVTGVAPGTALSDQAKQIQAYITANDKVDACNGLAKFIGLVKAQTGKKLTQAQASTYIAEAQAIESSLGC
jgi:molybdopterin synthase catalytic subunit